MRARTAVIPAAGMGTRFLPATKAVPKELLPIIDTPALQLIIDEAVGAGFDHVVVITSHAKPAIEAYFKPAPEIMAKLRKSGRGALADRLQRTADSARISFAYQDDPHGLGHAVGCAREAVRDESFAVLLPDEIMGDSSLLAQMADVAAASGGSVVGLKRVPPAEVSAYGVVETDGDVDADGVVRVRTVVEKPAMKDAPSDLILIGRYVLAPGTFEAIDRVVPAADGEIQLTDALKMLAADGPFHGVVSKISRYDTGNPFGWLTAVVDLALDDEQIGTQFRAWLENRQV